MITAEAKMHDHGGEQVHHHGRRIDPRLDPTYLRSRRHSRPVQVYVHTYGGDGARAQINTYVDIYGHGGDGAQVHICVHMYGGSADTRSRPTRRCTTTARRADGPRRARRYTTTASAQMHGHDDRASARPRRRRHTTTARQQIHNCDGGADEPQRTHRCTTTTATQIHDQSGGADARSRRQRRCTTFPEFPSKGMMEFAPSSK